MRDTDCLLRNIIIKNDTLATYNGSITHFVSELTPSGTVSVTQVTTFGYTVPAGTENTYTIGMIDGKINFLVLTVGTETYAIPFLVLCALTRCYMNLAMQAFCTPIVDCTSCEVQDNAKAAASALSTLSEMITAIHLAYANLVGADGLISVFQEGDNAVSQYANNIKSLLQLLYKTTKYSEKCNINCNDDIQNNCPTCV